MRDGIYPTMVIRSQAEVIKLLEQENKELKEYIKELEENSGVLVSQVESWSKTADIYLEKSIRVQKENQSLRTRIKTIKRRRKHQTQKLNKYKLVVTDLRNALEKKNNKIDKAIEYMNGEEFFLLMNSIQTPDKAVCEDYFKAKGNLLEILKDSDVDE